MAVDVHRAYFPVEVNPWTNIFQIFGVATALWSIFIFFLLPDTISDAKFLTEEEKQYAEDRVLLFGTGRVDQNTSKWKIEQVWECLKDIKTYFFAPVVLLTQVSLLLRIYIKELTLKSCRMAAPEPS
jgi:hypothetical protein